MSANTSQGKHAIVTADAVGPGHTNTLAFAEQGVDVVICDLRSGIVKVAKQRAG